MSWLENEDKVEPKKSAKGMEAVFCQIQYNLEYWSSGIQNLKTPEEEGNQHSFIIYYLEDTLSFNFIFTLLLQAGYYYA